ncbi:MAG: hypothetical protein IPM81_20170 [Saprospirales bacterium]|nr:hypothetical protein [Saprospirales bacterium]
MPVMTGFANYLAEKCRNEYNYEEASGFYKQAERLYMALLRLDGSAEIREKLASLYGNWADISLYKGRFEDAREFLDKPRELLRFGEEAAPESVRMVEAHILLLSDKFGPAIQAYNGLLDPKQQGKEVKNDAMVSSFRRLALSDVWSNDRSQQMLVEKALRLIGVPLVADTALAERYGIAPLQTRNIPLGDLIASIKGPDSLTKKQVLLIIGIYNQEVKEEIGPKFLNLPSKKIL